MNDNDPSRRAAFELPNIRLAQGVVLLLASLAFSCAGKTNDPQTLALCGSSCSAEQVSASCSSTCNKMIASGCYKNQDLASCTHDCIEFGNATKCPKAVEFLRCAESVTPTCVAGDPDFGPACMPILKEADKCGGHSDVSAPVQVPVGTPVEATDAGSGVSVPVDDPAICPNIPRRAGGGGPCAGSSGGSEGPDAALACTASCQDNTGNIWEASCNGNTCTCSYNGAQMCTCTITVVAGACPSCCPGTSSQ